MAKIITGEKPLIIPPQLALQIGKWEALLLQQIHHHAQHSKHLIDGAKWFYKTFKDWAVEIPFISLGTIRRAIANLRQLGLILVERHSAKKSCYQANWYRPDYDAIRSLLADASDRNDRVHAIAQGTSINTETNSTENLSTHTPPQPPSSDELKEAERELRKCRINPASVMREVLRWYANFEGAIARTKEAQKQGWCTNPTGVFLKALKLGLGAESPSFKREKFEIPAPPEGLEDWAIAHSDQVKDIFFSSVNRCWMVVYRSEIQRVWHEAMGVEQ